MRREVIAGGLLVLMLSLVVVYGVDDIYAFLVAFFVRAFFFVKRNIISLFVTFFLVNGKFILTIFLKKIALLSVTGLGKRYIIEKVVMENFKIHFIEHLKEDIKRFFIHAKKNFSRFTIVKKIITIFAFIGSLGFVGNFMGSMIAIKVFVAKVWSFLLAIFLKVGSSVLYFFTDYLWSSWLAPIIEVVIFSWLLSWMEKVPFLAKILRKFYNFFIYFFGWMESYADKIFHKPLKKVLNWLVHKIQKWIYDFIGYQGSSAWSRLKQKRAMKKNIYTKLIDKRKKEKESKNIKDYISKRDRLLKKRNEHQNR
ncbi:MAG: hypothetical protein QM493_01820 [Sulfurovum sp.]